jgi:hypothetical protein
MERRWRSLSVSLWILSQATPCLSQNFSVQVQSPTSGIVAGDNVSIQVSITSTYELKSVVGSVDSSSTNLSFSVANSKWTNNLSLIGLSLGQKTLIISAKDVFGNSGGTQITFVHDYPPVLNVMAPIDTSVAIAGVVPINASASSSNPGGTIISVTFNGIVLASGTNILITSVTIPSEGPQSVTFTATNAAGQITTVDRTLLVYNVTNLTRVDQVTGTILDVSTNKILFRDGTVFKAKDRSAGTETELFNDPYPGSPYTGVLTPQGAIFYWPNSGSLDMFELRSGVVTDLGIGFFLDVNQHYALWAMGGLVLYDLTTQTTNVLQAGIADGGSLAPNGDVAYVWEPWKLDIWDVGWYHKGVTTNLASGAFIYSYSGALSDGTNVIYEKRELVGRPYIALNTGVGETILSTNSPDVVPTFAINSGWIAFTATGASGVTQVWLRSPAGVQNQVTFFGTSSGVVALSASGDVVYRNSGHGYLARSGSAPLDLGYDWTWDTWDQSTPGNPKFFWQGGTLYFRLGDSVFALVSPVTLTAGWASAGELKIGVAGLNDVRVITQSSTNQVNWVNISTNFLNHTNSVEVLDSISAPANFYRAVISK